VAADVTAGLHASCVALPFYVPVAMWLFINRLSSSRPCRGLSCWPGIDHVPAGPWDAGEFDRRPTRLWGLSRRRTPGRCPGPNQSLSRSSASACRRLSDAGTRWQGVSIAM